MPFVIPSGWSTPIHQIWCYTVRLELLTREFCLQSFPSPSSPSISLFRFLSTLKFSANFDLSSLITSWVLSIYVCFGLICFCFFCSCVKLEEILQKLNFFNKSVLLVAKKRKTKLVFLLSSYSSFNICLKHLLREIQNVKDHHHYTNHNNQIKRWKLCYVTCFMINVYPCYYDE